MGLTLVILFSCIQRNRCIRLDQVHDIKVTDWLFYFVKCDQGVNTMATKIFTLVVVY